MDYSTAIISGALFGLFIAISVGPTLFAVIRNSISYSYKAGLAFILGVSISDILYVLVANLATSALRFFEEHQKVIGISVSILFIIIGMTGFFMKYKPKKNNKKRKEISLSKKTYFAILLSGFFMNTFNPAVTILWLGAVLQISKAQYNQTESFLFFAVCLCIVLSADISKVFLAEKIRNLLTVRKIFYVNKISALIIFLFGVFLLIYQFY